MIACTLFLPIFTAAKDEKYFTYLINTVRTLKINSYWYMIHPNPRFFDSVCIIFILHVSIRGTPYSSISFCKIHKFFFPLLFNRCIVSLLFYYRISANSCSDIYSFLEVWVQQLFKGGNYLLIYLLDGINNLNCCCKLILIGSF